MAAIDTVRNLMHGERKMCSVCEIARETGLDTETVKPLMVKIAGEQPRYRPIMRKDNPLQPRVNIPSGRPRRAYSDTELRLLTEMYHDGKQAREIAAVLERDESALKNKIWHLQKQGILPWRNQKREEKQND